MTIDVKRLLKKCRNWISDVLNFTPAKAKTTLAGMHGPTAWDAETKPSGTRFDGLGAESEASPQNLRWESFFNGLLNPQSVPESERSTSAAAVSKGYVMPEPSSADDEDMMHLFAGRAVVETLKARLDKLPDIRQPRVNLLKQTMAEGKYQLYPQQIAAAMFADGALNFG